MILVIIAIVSIIPMIILSFSAHTQYDDFYYSVKTYHAMRDGTSVIGAAIDQTKETYFDWQGSYSAIFLFSLHPGIWGESFYFLTTFIMLGSLIAATFFFSYVVLKKYFNASRVVFLTVTIALLVAQIQLLPSANQAFYWYNGSIYYLFFYALALVLFSLLLILLKTKKLYAKIICITLSIILAAILGGGNLITGLSSLFILFLAIGYLIYKKNKHAFAFSAVFIVFLAGFAFNILAPGNAIRQANHTEHPGAVLAVIESFHFSAFQIYEFISIPVILLAVLLFPLLWKMAKSSQLKFKYPLAFVALTYICFTTQFTPTVYAWGGLGEKRIENIIFFSFIIMLLADLFYIGGYLSRKTNLDCQKAIDFFKKISTVSCVIIVGFVITVFAGLNSEPHFDYINFSGLSSTSAVYSIASGEAREYDEACNKRIEVLNDPSETKVEFDPLPQKPHCLFYGDLLGYDDRYWMWANKPMADCFDKEYVYVNWNN